MENKGIDPNRAILADLFRDDPSLQYGLVVTEQGRVIEFDFSWRDRAREQGSFSTWQDITDEWEHNPWREQISCALAMLQQG